MTGYWVAMTAMFLLAIALAVLPLVRARQANVDRSKGLNLQLTRQRLLELDKELQEGLIDAADKKTAEDELKMAMVLEQQEKVALRQKSSLIPLLLLVIGLVVASASYWQANQLSLLQGWQQAMEDLGPLGRRVVVEADPNLTADELQRFALALRTKLKEDPSSPEGWLLLGRLYASLGRLDTAIESYHKALDLDPARPSTLQSLAQALLMSNDEQNIREAKAYLLRLRALAPDNEGAMGLLAIAATQLGDKALALSNWQALKDRLPADDPMQQEVANRMAQLSPQAQTKLMLTVNMAAELQARLPENGYLFVFARDAQGQSRLPAAVVKQPLSAFPITVSLTDDDAMMPGVNLSSLKQATLVARVSLDDKVELQPGELQGEINLAIEPGNELSSAITIDKEIQ
ncbi:c-type cytochrome biogenesis protein CcmI [Aliiglaciecola sp. CAU 1673]|uniref:c-type cytochrome biogenesis protein CcmI n=1 Tax=Aliiglaciecola sp. CAU 1673 TaxID=3032595 RepID=UPI0023D9DCE5|nr:c-type cytochrome biogenesis protein CcmI [Aliiglaciecola sp. CAU 1673]MDF2177493.1 c-type cytochrome biogenesis protein CcmI [Aliiglaciecola sp. CAU 1673]